MTITDAQWEDLLYRRKEPGDPADLSEGITGTLVPEFTTRSGAPKIETEDDLYVYEDDKDAVPETRPGDWIGLERDRRSAYLVVGALKSEGLL